MINKKALIISDYDSRIAWSCGFASRLKKNGFSNTFISLNPKDNIDSLSIRKYLDEVYYVESFQSLDERFNEQFSIVLLAVGGTMHLKIYDIFQSVYASAAVRPILVTGFNGIEDIADPDGMFCRSISDYVCINNSDFYEYASYILQSYGLSSQLFRTGFIRDYWELERSKEITLKRVMFILQPGILDHPKQLEHLGNWLLTYSKRFPERQIILKARGRKNIEHVNSKYEKDRFLEFWEEICELSNGKLSLVFMEMEEVLPSVDLVLSYTSAGLIEALILGKKAAAISDFGVSKSIGNAFLLDSNLLTSTSSLLNDNISEVDSKWYQRWCSYDPNLADELIEICHEKYSNQYESGKLDFVQGYYNSSNHPYLFRFRDFYLTSEVSSKSILRSLKNNIKAIFNKLT